MEKRETRKQKGDILKLGDISTFYVVLQTINRCIITKRAPTGKAPTRAF